MNYKDNGIFIVGCPRPRTTLLRIILDSHSKICAGEETGILAYMDKLFKDRWKQLKYYPVTQKEFFEKIKEFFLFFHHRNCDISQKSIWIDKTPAHGKHLEFICNLFPKSKIIHIIRDGRDVAASYKEKWGKRAFFSALYDWVNYVRFIRKFGLRLSNRYYELRYEDLLNNPEAVLKNLLKFLELEWEDNLLNYFSFSHNLLVENANIDSRPFKPFLKDRIGSWKNRLSLTEKFLVSLGFRNLLIELRYIKGKSNNFLKKWGKIALYLV